MESNRILIKKKKPLPESIMVQLPDSKSLWARLLMLYATAQKPLPELPPMMADDVKAMRNALMQAREKATEIDVVESGTAMRFLTAYLAATTKHEVVLKGRGRQYQRPIGALVDSLLTMGADIEYIKEKGYPPLRIRPAQMHGGTVEIDAGQSSQFVSALLLIAPLLKEKTEIVYDREEMAPSAPYIQMTKQLIRDFDPSMPLAPMVERDWTAASALYTLCALTKTKVRMPGLKQHSLQGDAKKLIEIFSQIGVLTWFTPQGAILCRMGKPRIKELKANFEQHPDIVPNVVAACLGLHIPFHLSGVGRLRLKESDRLMAIQRNASAAGFHIGVTSDALFYDGCVPSVSNTPPVIDPMGDHRIAMAFALLACKLPQGVAMEEAQVVAKSWPDFWECFKLICQITDY